jgi:hypothetical protein
MNTISIDRLNQHDTVARVDTIKFLFLQMARTLSWKQCSRPGTPCVLVDEPTAMINLSSIPPGQHVHDDQLDPAACNTGTTTRLTRHITPHLSAIIVLEDLDLEQPFAHVHIHGPTGHVMSTNTGDDLSEGFDQGSGFDRPYARAGGYQERRWFGNVWV